MFVFLLSLKFISFKHADIRWTFVRKANISIQQFEAGEIKAVQSIDIKVPKVALPELQILYITPDGNDVDIGDTLIVFESQDLIDLLENTEDEYEALSAEKDKQIAIHESQLKQLQMDYENAKYSLEIYELNKEHLKYESEVSQREGEFEYEKARLGLIESQEAISSQKILDEIELVQLNVQISYSAEKLEEIHRQIEMLTMRAPQKGMVVYNEIRGRGAITKVAKGEKVRPGQEILRISNLEKMSVVLQVSELDVFKFKIGQKASVSLDAYPDENFNGEVCRVCLLNSFNSESSLKVFDVTIALNATEGLIKPGMTAKARIAQQHFEDVLLIPLGCIYELNNQAFVFPENDYPNPRAVTLHERGDEYIIIESPDLKEGERIAYDSPDSKFHRIGYDDFVKNWINNGEAFERELAKISRQTKSSMNNFIDEDRNDEKGTERKLSDIESMLRKRRSSRKSAPDIPRNRRKF